MPLRVPAGGTLDERQIRFRLASLRGHGQLDADSPPAGELLGKHITHVVDRRAMHWVVDHLLENPSVEELDPVVLAEHPHFRQPVILRYGEPPDRDRRERAEIRESRW
jgi:hypothetical protein